jgi:hypothetical protein
MQNIKNSYIRYCLPSSMTKVAKEVKAIVVPYSITTNEPLSNLFIFVKVIQNFKQKAGVLFNLEAR